jgi:hypothetical protein
LWLPSQATNDVLQPGLDFPGLSRPPNPIFTLCFALQRAEAHLHQAKISPLELNDLQHLVVMYNLNPACYVPSGVAQYLPSSIACAPPPSYFAQAYSALTSPFASTYSTLRTLMNAVVSLPALSFLLIPTMTSYSTSLNLLFFYITWSTLYVFRIICDGFLDFVNHDKGTSR